MSCQVQFERVRVSWKPGRGWRVETGASRPEARQILRFANQDLASPTPDDAYGWNLGKRLAERFGGTVISKTTDRIESEPDRVY